MQNSKKIVLSIQLVRTLSRTLSIVRTLSRKYPARESLFFWQKLQGNSCKIRGGSNGKCIKIIGRNAWFSSFEFFSSGPAKVYRYLFVRKVCQNAISFFLILFVSESKGLIEMHHDACNLSTSATISHLRFRE